MKECSEQDLQGLPGRLAEGISRLKELWLYPGLCYVDNGQGLNSRILVDMGIIMDEYSSSRLHHETVEIVDAVLPGRILRSTTNLRKRGTGTMLLAMRMITNIECCFHFELGSIDYLDDSTCLLEHESNRLHDRRCSIDVPCMHKSSRM
jgi:hypothetical protein